MQSVKGHNPSHPINLQNRPNIPMTIVSGIPCYSFLKNQQHTNLWKPHRILLLVLVCAYLLLLQHTHSFSGYGAISRPWKIPKRKTDHPLTDGEPSNCSDHQVTRPVFSRSSRHAHQQLYRSTTLADNVDSTNAVHDDQEFRKCRRRRRTHDLRLR